MTATRTTAARTAVTASVSVLALGAVTALAACGTAAGATSVTTAATTAVTRAGAGTATTTTAPTGVPTTRTTTRPGTTAPTAPAAASRVATGAPEALYLVGTDAKGARLFREFVAVPQGAAPGGAADQRATRAVAAAMAAPAPYRRLWGERSVASVRREASGIVVTLAPGSSPALSAADARLAVASLVWTVTAAYQADLPVRIVEPGRTTTVGGLSTATAFRRGDGAGVLAGIWVDRPALGATLPAGRVVASGRASVWEATVTWNLSRDGAVLRRGVTTAEVGAPARGGWSVDLGALTPGTYTLVLTAPSPKDGADMARTVRTFRVR